jgi:hypothetical protein
MGKTRRRKESAAGTAEDAEYTESDSKEKGKRMGPNESEAEADLLSVRTPTVRKKNPREVAVSINGLNFL